MKNINQLCLLTLSRYNKTEQRYKPETQNGLCPISMSIFRSWSPNWGNVWKERTM